MDPYVKKHLNIEPKLTHSINTNIHTMLFSDAHDPTPVKTSEMEAGRSAIAPRALALNAQVEVWIPEVKHTTG